MGRGIAHWWTMRPQWLIWPLVLGGVFLFLRWAAGRSLYYPVRYPQGWWEAQQRLGAVDVWLTGADGTRLHGWWMDEPGARVATLYLHGNGGNITHRAAVARLLTAAGSSVLLLDYRGYGRSAGRPTEAGLYQDAEAAYEWLMRRSAGPERLVLHGESLGTAVAVELGSRRECAGMVLAAPFSSARAVAARVLPVLGPMLVGGYDSKARIGKVRAPILFLHGDRDEVIAYEFGRELFAAAPEPKWFWTVEGAMHNDIPEVAGAEYTKRLKDFYSKL